MRVLHISADFPDPLGPAKSRAVSMLIDLVPEHEHVVYSLNRVSWAKGVASVPFGRDWRALTYGSPPYGLMLRRGLDAVAAFIVEDATRRGLRPDVVHGHKVCVEGPIAEAVADALGAPFLVSSMADSDLKIIGAKPELRGLWRRVWGRAGAAIAYAPWAADAIAGLLGAPAAPVRIVPAPTAQDLIRPPRVVGPLVRSVFHMASWRRKNADGLIAALERAARAEPDIRLEIAGGGDPAGFAAVARLARRAADRVRLIGPVPHDQMGAFLNGSGGFVLPSHRESYGMVFAEALMSGVPVVHGAGNAITGLMPDEEVARGVPTRDPDAIAEQLLRLVRDEEPLKRRLAALQERGALDPMRRTAIAAGYLAALSAATDPKRMAVQSP